MKELNCHESIHLLVVLQKIGPDITEMEKTPTTLHKYLWMLILWILIFSRLDKIGFYLADHQVSSAVPTHVTKKKKKMETQKSDLMEIPTDWKKSRFIVLKFSLPCWNTHCILLIITKQHCIRKGIHHYAWHYISSYHIFFKRWLYRKSTIET